MQPVQVGHYAAGSQSPGEFRLPACLRRVGVLMGFVTAGGGPDPGLPDRIERIVGEHWSDLLGVARKHGPGRDYAPDIVQAAVVKVLSGEAELRDGVDPLPRLVEVVKNEARNCRRYEGVRRTEPLDEAASLATGSEGGPDVGWSLYRRLRIRGEMAEALGKLGAEKREVAEARLFEEFLLREIAERMECAAALFSPGPPAHAETVQGSVTDALTEPVAAARVTLLIDGGDEYVWTTLTNAEGRFRIPVGAEGTYVLELDRLGYHAGHTEAFELSGEGVTRQDGQLEPDAIELEGIRAEVYAGQLLHDATLSGVYARRARSPSVGGNRVRVRGQDPESETAQVLQDMLPQWLSYVRPPCARLRRSHPVILFNGWEAEAAGWSSRELLRAFPVRQVVAIEYYRDFNSVPMSLRPTDHAAFDFTIVRACGLLAIWTRGAPR